MNPTSQRLSVLGALILFACNPAVEVVATLPAHDGAVTAPPTQPGRSLDAGFTFVVPDGGAVTPPTGCASAPGDDADQDGYTVDQGDCNDCDKLVNPGAYDVPGNQVDEDCNGTADDEPLACDDGLAVEGDAESAARALGICRLASGDGTPGKPRTWGLVRAAYVFPDGSTAGLRGGESDPCGKAGAPPNPLSHGILPRFGAAVKPRQGATLVALSSGVARSGPSTLAGKPSPEAAQMCTRSRTPAGFPVSSYSTCGDLELLPPSIPTSQDAQDGIALELVIRAPTNAQALSFDFDFYTFEYSNYVCSEFNDAFVALLSSKSPDVPPNHNIAFDSQKNPVSVNNGFVEVCSPFTYQGRKGQTPFERAFPCRLGTGELAGTGFEEHAATGWLETHTNVIPGEELTIRFAIWDAGDDILDSTVLLDHFVWMVKPGTTVTVRPPPIQ